MNPIKHDRVTTPLALLEAGRKELIDATLGGGAGRAAVERYADRIDAVINQIVAEASPPKHTASVFALGGYGRRHLCLYSDVDILVVFDGPLDADDERFVRDLLQPLWDLKLVLGHQVRELADFARLERDNPEFLLALLESPAS